MKCSKKIINPCGKKTNANCVDYTGGLHVETKLDICDSPTATDVIEDINEYLDEVSDSLDLSGLGKGCITYSKEGDTLKSREALIAIEDKVCEIADFVGLPKSECDGCPECSPIFNLNIECLGLDFGELTDPCGEQPTTLKELLELIISQIKK